MDQPPRDPRSARAASRLNYSVSRLARGLNRATEVVAVAHGITLSQFLLLQILGEGVPLSNAQVARKTSISSQSSHETMTALVDQGLITRVAHEANRRVLLACLTEQGWALLSECTAEILPGEERLLSELGEQGHAFAQMTERAGSILADGFFGEGCAAELG